MTSELDLFFIPTHPVHRSVERSTEFTLKLAMLCLSLAREGRNVCFADVGVSSLNGMGTLKMLQ
jgi:hypothetical protein